MAQRLNALFVLAVLVAGAGLFVSDVSTPLLFLLVIPAGALLFTVSAFVFFLAAVIFEKAPQPRVAIKHDAEHWLGDVPLQHSQG